MNRHAGFHGRGVGFGERPALVVVDMNVGFTDPESPLACDLEDVVDAIQACCGSAASGRPGRLHDGRLRRGEQAQGGGVHRESAGAADAGGRKPLGRDRPADRAAARRAGPPRLHASAFFETELAELLAAPECDSVIVTGASTSGCVRATAVDALQHGYRTVVPREAVGDRNPEAHAANLYDIDAKYGDVVSLEEALGRLEELAGTHAR